MLACARSMEICSCSCKSSTVNDNHTTEQAKKQPNDMSCDCQRLHITPTLTSTLHPKQCLPGLKSQFLRTEATTLLFARALNQNCKCLTRLFKRWQSLQHADPGGADCLVPKSRGDYPPPQTPHHAQDIDWVVWTCINPQHPCCVLLRLFWTNI